jgi:hypothetical protein
VSGDLFEWIDRQDFHLGPFHFNAVQSEDNIRRKILWLVAASAVAWGFFGWDSTWEMISPLWDTFLHRPLDLVPSLLDRGSAMWSQTQVYYGMGDHWSAFVFYGLAYYFLSKYLQGVGVVKSFNFFAATCLSLMNVGIFEVVWNLCYGNFQGQQWIYALIPGTNRFAPWLMMFFFVFLGVLMLILLYMQGYRVVLEGWKVALILGAVAMWINWILYAQFNHVQLLTVGTWTSSRLFPQTYYMVNEGTLYHQILSAHWVENNLLHGVNTLTKVFTTAAVAVVLMVKKKHV